MLLITDSTNKMSHTLNNSESIPSDEKENEFPPDVLARLKRLAEESAKTLEKDLDMLDIKIPPMEKEVQNCIERAENIEKYLRATVGKCNITSDGHSTPNELAEIAEKRISVNETLVKACEARNLTSSVEYPMTCQLMELRTTSYWKKQLQYCDAKTRDMLMQRFNVYNDLQGVYRAYAINNIYCLGRNVFFIEENITNIRGDAEKIMNQIDEEEKEEWKERLLLCDKHSSIIMEKGWDFSKQRWLNDSRMKSFYATYII